MISSLNTMTLPDWVGLAGAFMIVLAYFLLQTGRLSARSLSFSLVNGLGAAGILVSLVFDFNLPAFVIELFWLLISGYGVYRAIVARRQT